VFKHKSVKVSLQCEYEEVVRFDVSVYDVTSVHALHQVQQLDGHVHHDRLQVGQHGLQVALPRPVHQVLAYTTLCSTWPAGCSAETGSPGPDVYSITRY